MPKKKEEIDWTLTAALVLLAILVLKELGILKTLFNIDPEGSDLGYMTSAGLAFVIAKLHKLNDALSKQGERIAKIEGLLEKHS